MFGYIRPNKAELLVKDFARFRACYCGICKAIARRYGQIPRMSVSYDLTFLALLLIALSPVDGVLKLETCILNPLRKKPILKDHKALDFSADMAVLLTWLKAKDDIRDEKRIRGGLLTCCLTRSGKKALKIYPQIGSLIKSKLNELSVAEQGFPDLTAADIFGAILSELFAEAVRSVLPDLAPEFALALADSGAGLGRWTYLIDAIDDYEKDIHNDEWNPFSGLTIEAAKEKADFLLVQEEEALDRIFALLPYERDGAIIYNIIVLGLPQVRKTVMKGEN